MTADNSPSRSLVKANAGALPALGPELEEAAGYARAEKAEATRRAYRTDFVQFRSWCEAKRVPALPAAPEAVAAFLAAEATRGAKVSTISRRLAAICYAHKLARHEPPTNSETVKATLRGIRRKAGSAPVRKVPATTDKVLAMVAEAGTDLKGIRDRAILLLGFAGAFRRSELVALNIADLEFCDGGLRVTIRKAKLIKRVLEPRSQLLSVLSLAQLMRCAHGSRRRESQKDPYSDPSLGQQTSRLAGFLT
jgi:site-specific recombinase XerD